MYIHNSNHSFIHSFFIMSTILSSLVFPVSLLLDCKQYNEQHFSLCTKKLRDVYFNKDMKLLLAIPQQHVYVEIRFTNGESWGVLSIAKLYASITHWPTIQREWCMTTTRLLSIPVYNNTYSLPYSCTNHHLFTYNTKEIRTAILNRLCLYHWILSTTPMHDTCTHDDLLFRMDEQADEQSYWCIRVLIEKYGTPQQVRDFQTCEQWIAEQRIQFQIAPLFPEPSAQLHKQVLVQLMSSIAEDDVEWKEPDCNTNMDHEELKLQVLGSHEFCRSCCMPYMGVPDTDTNDALAVEYTHLRQKIAPAIPPCLHQDAWRCCLTLIASGVHLTQSLWNLYCYHMYKDRSWRSNGYLYTTLGRTDSNECGGSGPGCDNMRTNHLCPYQSNLQCISTIVKDMEDIVVPPYYSPTTYINIRLGRYHIPKPKPKANVGKRKSISSSSNHSNANHHGGGVLGEKRDQRCVKKVRKEK
jgi:hypothetical protein